MDYVYISGERRTLDAATRCSNDHSNGVQFLIAILLVYGRNSQGFWCHDAVKVLCCKQLERRLLLQIMHIVL